MKAIERKKASRRLHEREGGRDEAGEASERGSVSAPIAAVFGIAGVF